LFSFKTYFTLSISLAKYKHNKNEKKKWREKIKNFFSPFKKEKAIFQLFYHTRWFSKENSEKDNT
jgi:hypothetical protein